MEQTAKPLKNFQPTSSQVWRMSIFYMAKNKTKTKEPG